MSSTPNAAPQPQTGKSFLFLSRYSRMRQIMIGVPWKNAYNKSGLDQYSDPDDRFWHLYLSDADKLDKKMANNLKGDTDGILIFVCGVLFFLLVLA
jgi:hypothetical protein